MRHKCQDSPKHPTLTQGSTALNSNLRGNTNLTDQGFSALLTFGLNISVVGGCPVRCKMFSSISGFYPVDAGSNS